MTVTLPSILRYRAIIFVIVVLVSLTWTILLSVDLFLRYKEFNDFEFAISGLLIAAHAVTAIGLLVLLLLEFRIWLDAMRVFALLVIHIAFSTLYATHNETFPCALRALEDPDREAVCELLDLLILLGNCLTPALLLLYGGCLAIVYFVSETRPLTINLMDEEFSSADTASETRCSPNANNESVGQHRTARQVQRLTYIDESGQRTLPWFD